MTDDNIIDDFKDDFSLFIEAGFIAVKQLDEIAAKRLFKAADLFRPGNLASQLGLGYIALNKLQLNEASKIFEAIIEKDPSHHLAKAFLGICYIINATTREKGKALILEVQQATDDPSILNLATVCLDWAKSDLKKKAFSPLAISNEEQEKPK